MSRRVARVLLDSPLPQLDRLFDYQLPDALGEVAVGVRVRVPLRTAGRVVDGFVIEIADEADGERTLSAVEAVVSDVAVLPERLYTLARRVADRAAGSASDIIRLAVPKRQVRVEKAWLRSSEPVTPTSDAAERANGILAEYGDLADLLADHGRAAVEAMPLSDEHGAPLWPQLIAAAAARTLAAGESSVLVVPDHRDLDALLAALSDVVPASVVVRHDSRQSNPDRYRAFLRTLEDAPCIVVGNRSAVYTPVRAGLVAMWDDGDALLSEPLAPYVHARDAALVRQEQEGSALLFVAHTRSTDVERLVATGWLDSVHAPRRVRPKVSLSTTEELEQPGVRLTPTAFRAAREALSSGPVLVQVSDRVSPPRWSAATAGIRPAARAAAGRSVHGAGGGAGVRMVRPHRHGVDLHLLPGQYLPALLVRQRAYGRRAGARLPRHPCHRRRRRPPRRVRHRRACARRGDPRCGTAGRRRIPGGAAARRRPHAPVARSADRRVVPAMVVECGGSGDARCPIHLVGVDGPVAKAFATWSHAAHARSELAERAPLRMPPVVRVAQVDGTVASVARALESLRELQLPADAILGPVPVASDDGGDAGRVRALVRFDYRLGARVAAALRASVVADAVSRRRGKGGPPAVRSQ
ncbi:primosomal protein N' [Microbacterium sp. NIBRBAC000506063]|uniref:primosomal protein N' family DNA-binding protein n=1 Tax=Microbacterium sp. NIBRBAC000506063 TaxID=2734618 RepID=UPI002948C165|nr:primosomal protein N' [Microbacterium sp. NIBRBAC000506063]